ncbi:hypothetical protein CXG81DRAFT_28301 [Caulochytrium protostelioides]|uniref:Uncharacterized protein n=1 Tax=Caulochytrium protostelioides TaxID=1555241 RepID=A0A4V1IU08_9FUNG|nr:hypothetical protein CXG81DRAFT_28301 [Caulochytrium protostelioides]|eukprot:RKO98907.1 hypothetical protein CXG81DRAFT_28301 [Caulochytrium protostelioides]
MASLPCRSSHPVVSAPVSAALASHAPAAAHDVDVDVDVDFDADSDFNIDTHFEDSVALTSPSYAAASSPSPADRASSSHADTPCRAPDPPHPGAGAQPGTAESSPAGGRDGPLARSVSHHALETDIVLLHRMLAMLADRPSHWPLLRIPPTQADAEGHTVHDLAVVKQKLDFPTMSTPEEQLAFRSFLIQALTHRLVPPQHWPPAPRPVAGAESATSPTPSSTRPSPYERLETWTAYVLGHGDPAAIPQILDLFACHAVPLTMDTVTVLAGRYMELLRPGTSLPYEYGSRHWDPTASASAAPLPAAEGPASMTPAQRSEAAACLNSAMTFIRLLQPYPNHVLSYAPSLVIEALCCVWHRASVPLVRLAETLHDVGGVPDFMLVGPDLVAYAARKLESLPETSQLLAHPLLRPVLEVCGVPALLRDLLPIAVTTEDPAVGAAALRAVVQVAPPSLRHELETLDEHWYPSVRPPAEPAIGAGREEGSAAPSQALASTAASTAAAADAMAVAQPLPASQEPPSAPPVTFDQEWEQMRTALPPLPPTANPFPTREALRRLLDANTHLVHAPLLPHSGGDAGAAAPRPLVMATSQLLALLERAAASTLTFEDEWRQILDDPQDASDASPVPPVSPHGVETTAVPDAAFWLILQCLLRHHAYPLAAQTLHRWRTATAPILALDVPLVDVPITPMTAPATAPSIVSPTATAEEAAHVGLALVNAMRKTRSAVDQTVARARYTRQLMVPGWVDEGGRSSSSSTASGRSGAAVWAQVLHHSPYPTHPAFYFVLAACQLHRDPRMRNHAPTNVFRRAWSAVHTQYDHALCLAAGFVAAGNAYLVRGSLGPVLRLTSDPRVLSSNGPRAKTTGLHALLMYLVAQRPMQRDHVVEDVAHQLLDLAYPLPGYLVDRLLAALGAAGGPRAVPAIDQLLRRACAAPAGSAVATAITADTMAALIRHHVVADRHYIYVAKWMRIATHQLGLVMPARLYVTLMTAAARQQPAHHAAQLVRAWYADLTATTPVTALDLDDVGRLLSALAAIGDDDAVAAAATAAFAGIEVLPTGLAATCYRIVAASRHAALMALVEPRSRARFVYLATRPDLKPVQAPRLTAYVAALQAMGRGDDAWVLIDLIWKGPRLPALAAMGDPVPQRSDVLLMREIAVQCPRSGSSTRAAAASSSSSSSQGPAAPAVVPKGLSTGLLDIAMAVLIDQPRSGAWKYQAVQTLWTRIVIAAEWPPTAHALAAYYRALYNSSGAAALPYVMRHLTAVTAAWQRQQPPPPSPVLPVPFYLALLSVLSDGASALASASKPPQRPPLEAVASRRVLRMLQQNDMDVYHQVQRLLPYVTRRHVPHAGVAASVRLPSPPPPPLPRVTAAAGAGLGADPPTSPQDDALIPHMAPLVPVPPSPPSPPPSRPFEWELFSEALLRPPRLTPSPSLLTPTPGTRNP